MCYTAQIGCVFIQGRADFIGGEFSMEKDLYYTATTTFWKIEKEKVDTCATFYALSFPLSLLKIAAWPSQ